MKPWILELENGNGTLNFRIGKFSSEAEAVAAMPEHGVYNVWRAGSDADVAWTQYIDREAQSWRGECATRQRRTMTKLSPNRVREILAVSLRDDSMLGVDVEREELTALAQEVCDLRTANGLLDSHIVSLEKDIADRDRQIADFIEWLKNHDPSPVVREMAVDATRDGRRHTCDAESESAQGSAMCSVCGALWGKPRMAEGVR